ncbi:MAG TPA: hypothetical protein PLW68_04445 [Casimicrobiaceae bacterium]|nr:hypothetical protein [Casimicrobiaceae bacterium]
MSAQPNAVADGLLADLAASPDSYPQKLDLIRDAVLLVRLDAAAYRAASFLDDRILGPATQGAWLPANVVADEARRIGSGRPVHFIFHTGHVGSTLVSRLLDETGHVLSVREPLPLRTLAEASAVLGEPESLLSDTQFGAHLETFMTLWSRGYAATRAVVVKATSSAGRLAVPILSHRVASRAVYMNLGAEPYLATLLAGQNSPLDLRGHGPGRIRSLQARTRVPLAPLHALSLGELTAMSWLAESWAQHDALQADPARVVALDFDGFLANVEEGMRKVLSHFALPADPGYLGSVARSPVLASYSKAPEFAYSPAVRAEIQNGSRRVNREEIRKGMAWLQRIARADAGAAAVVTGGGV